MGLAPLQLQGWLFPQSGPERNLYVCLPALFRTLPSVA